MSIVESLLRLCHVGMLVLVVLIAVNDPGRQLNVLLPERRGAVWTKLGPGLLCTSRLPPDLAQSGLVVRGVVALGGCKIRSLAQIGVYSAFGAVFLDTLRNCGSLGGSTFETTFPTAVSTTALGTFRCFAESDLWIQSRAQDRVGSRGRIGWVFARAAATAATMAPRINLWHDRIVE